METTVSKEEGFKKPRTDLSSCIGNPVILYLKEEEALKALKLPVKDGKIECRLVGVERFGIWIEPEKWVETSVKEQKPLHHVFLLWENVLSIMKAYETSDFMAVREYRGLRPRA